MTVCEGIYYDFFDFRLDVEKQQLLKNGEPVQLTYKAFQVLLLLVQNSGQISKKEDIFTKLWADSFVEDANLTQHIYVLRKVLGQTPNGQSYIETVPKQGYRFTLQPDQISVINPSDKTQEFELNEIDDSFSEKTIQEISLSDGKLQHLETINFKENGRKDLSLSMADKFVQPPVFTEVAKPRLLSRSRFFVAALLLFFGVVATATTIYYFRQKPEQTIITDNVKSIAVLPFKPIGDEVDKEKLGLGMADAVIMKLSKIQQITVRPTSAVFSYTDQPTINAVSAGLELGVDAVLEGTVQSNGERVRVSVQLVQITDGKTLWAENFHEKASDIFSLQDLISTKVATALSINLTEKQEQLLEQRTTNSTEAFQDYQLGIYFWNKRTKEDLLKAVEYFQQAIEHDPNYAQAFAGLADSYGMLAFYGFADVGEMKEKARISAEKALALNDLLVEAYVALAMVYVIDKDDYPKALELLERAVTLAPYNASARHRYSWILLSNRRVDEAVREMNLAREYDPLSVAINRALCSVLILQRNFPDAVKQCEKSLEISLDTPNSRIYLARAYFYNGRYSAAFNQLKIQIETGKKEEVIYARAELAYFDAKLGQTTNAEKIYADLKKKFKKDRALVFELTLIGFALGKKDEALVYFKEMLKDLDKNRDLQLSLAYDPYWDEVKVDPQFAPLFPK
ncbi:MAG: winged helix-turn-helix domain-containing protein [Acidobacteria bacterium]|nr:winged helix-turn-helix domain-containing protein [Acidobacteriota bacterium]MCA1639125.1 winged helix-turn-helix domain-containing protein [Acidobacteriota bacterium]